MEMQRLKFFRSIYTWDRGLAFRDLAGQPGELRWWSRLSSLGRASSGTNITSRAAVFVHEPWNHPNCERLLFKWKSLSRIRCKYATSAWCYKHIVAPWSACPLDRDLDRDRAITEPISILIVQESYLFYLLCMLWQNANCEFESSGTFWSKMRGYRRQLAGDFLIYSKPNSNPTLQQDNQ